jgi:hypothetical protein
MFKRMIVPVSACAMLLAAMLAAGCKDTVLEGIQDRPSKLGALDSAASMPAAAPTRTDHFAESARRIRAHPALGPHTPAEIKRRVAALVEPLRLATPPPSILAAIPPHAFESEPLQHVAALTPREGAPVAPSAGDASSMPARAVPRNVVIPMVVTSADGGLWRAEGDKAVKGGARNTHCRDEALAQLKRHSDTGYRIYERLDDKRMFTTWILCDERQRGLTTAVHEAVHMLT